MSSELESTEYELELLAQRKLAEKAIAREVVNLVEDQTPMTQKKAIGFAVNYISYVTDAEYYDVDHSLAVQARGGLSWHNSGRSERVGKALSLVVERGEYITIAECLKRDIETEWGSHPIIQGRFVSVLDNLPRYGIPASPAIKPLLQEDLKLDSRDYIVQIRSWSSAVNK